MKVLHVMDHSLPRGDGYSIRAKYLLEAQARAGAEVVVLTGPAQGEEATTQTIAGIHYERTRFSAAEQAIAACGGKHLVFQKALARRIAEVLNGGQFDLVHAHTPATVAQPALVAARRHQLPFVYEKRNLWEESARVRGRLAGRWPFIGIARALDRRVTLRADAVCAITRAYAELILEQGVAGERITVVGNGVDVEEFRPCAPDPELRERCLTGGNIVFGFVGSFFSFEGLPLLVAAFAEMARAHPGARLVLVGDGEALQEVTERVATLGLAGKVWLTGRVPHAQVKSFYSAMDVLVYPRQRSLLTEVVSPLKPLEPMAMGKCVVGSDVGGLRDLIDHGRTGYLFAADSQSALAELLGRLASGTLDAVAAGSEASTAMTRERQWKHMAARYVTAYEIARRQLSLGERARAT